MRNVVAVFYVRRCALINRPIFWRHWAAGVVSRVCCESIMSTRGGELDLRAQMPLRWSRAPGEWCRSRPTASCSLIIRTALSRRRGLCIGRCSPGEWSRRRPMTGTWSLITADHCCWIFWITICGDLLDMWRAPRSGRFLDSGMLTQSPVQLLAQRLWQAGELFKLVAAGQRLEVQGKL
mmetsp:Transcript_73388/g.130164  ORF Transcript_73388/g.130164 Transcript_73388/m.130164 type:complete len:179 (+) Transcript_73388:166-702(+)